MTALPVDGHPNAPVRLLRVAAIVLVFAAVGPAVGGFSLIMMIAITQLGLGAGVSDLATIALFGLIYGIAIAYLIGTVPAAAVGLIVAIRQVYFGRVTVAMALALGVVVGVGFMLFVRSAASPETSSDFAELPVILVLTCVLPTFACWALVRNWYVRNAATEVGS